MPDVDVGALAEAWDQRKGFIWQVIPDEAWAVLDRLVRAVVEAPIAEWCFEHGKPATGKDLTSCDNYIPTGADFKPCRVGRVRLVAEPPTD